MDVGMSIKKELHAWMMAVRRRKMERRILVEVASMDVGLAIEKELHAWMTAMHRCKMERRLLVVST